MAPKLRVLISTSGAYPPTTECTVNSTTPTPFSTPSFRGDVSVWIKDFTGDNKGGDGHQYFDRRPGMTYGIVVRGTFLNELDMDDVMFGNVFEKPIRNSLPWGTAVGVKFIHYVEPTIELDLYADKPFALSPALASMNYVSFSRDAQTSSPGLVKEDSLSMLKELYTGESPPLDVDASGEKAARRKWLHVKEHRTGVKIDKDIHVGMEFCNGYLDFNTLSVTIPPPFYLSVPLLKYWDGQPVIYVCRKRSKDPVSKEGMLWSVAFEIVDEDARKRLEERDGKAVGPTDTKSPDGPADVVEEKGREDLSDDVD